MNDVIFGWNRVFVIGFAIAIVIGTYLLLTKTPLGLLIRAVMQNRSMAACMGVRTERVNMLTFALRQRPRRTGRRVPQPDRQCRPEPRPELHRRFLHDRGRRRRRQPHRHRHQRARHRHARSSRCSKSCGNPVLGKILVLGAIILFLQWRPAGCSSPRVAEPRKLMVHEAATHSPARFSLRLRRSSSICVGALLLVVVFPLLNAHGRTSSNFTLNLWGKYLCYALLAISRGSALGLHRPAQPRPGALLQPRRLHARHAPHADDRRARPVQAENPTCPTFMVFLGLDAAADVLEAVLSASRLRSTMVVLLPGLIAFVFGFLAFRSRIKGVYFSILTQALTYGAALMFFRNDMTHGRQQRLHRFQVHPRRTICASPATQRGLYIATAVTARCWSISLCRWLTRTKFGLVQRAIRDSETRVLFSGYAAANYKLFVFVLCRDHRRASAARSMCRRSASSIPSEMTPDKSLEAVVWCAVGGRGTLLGPIIGAIGVNALKSWATRAIADLLADHPRRLVHPRRALHAEGHRRPARRRSQDCLRQTQSRRCRLRDREPPRRKPPS